MISHRKKNSRLELNLKIYFTLHYNQCDGLICFLPSKEVPKFPPVICNVLKYKILSPLVVSGTAILSQFTTAYYARMKTKN